MRSLTRFPVVLACLVATSVLVLGTEARAVVFDDGMVHLIDAGNSFPFEGAIVRDGSGAASTSVQLVDGGEIGTEVEGDLEAFENSVVNISGGRIGLRDCQNDRTPGSPGAPIPLQPGPGPTSIGPE